MSKKSKYPEKISIKEDEESLAQGLWTWLSIEKTPLFSGMLSSVTSKEKGRLKHFKNPEAFNTVPTAVGLLFPGKLYLARLIKLRNFMEDFLR